MSDPSVKQSHGRYCLRGSLGKGGMGEVFRAYDPHLQREVALKSIPAQALSEPASRIRFASEARSLASIVDPHVVRIYDFNPDQNNPWLVMELIEGETLRGKIQSGQPLATQELYRCARECCVGLAAIHHAGLVHRDMKPDNIMRRGTNGSYVLLDLGLANEQGSQTDLTQSGAIVGTARYLSPERARGEAAIPTTDLYALAVVLYELATGSPVYAGLEGMAIIHKVATNPGLDLHLARPDLPADFLAWWTQLANPETSKRFANGGHALAAFKQLAPPPSAAEVNATAATQLMADEAPHRTSLSNDHTLPVLPPTDHVSPQALTKSATRTLRPAAVGESSGSWTKLSPLPERRQWRLRFVHKLVLALWLTSAAATLITGIFLSSKAIGDQKQNLRRMVRSAAASAALLVDGTEHQEFVQLGQGANTHPAFAATSQRLQAFRSKWPRVRYVYTMASIPESAETGVVVFMVDASDEVDLNDNKVIDPDEMVAEPMDRYDASELPMLHQGFVTPSADEEPFSDQWGTWLSGYAPILDADGEPTGGIVGIDIPVEQLEQMNREFMLSAAILIISSLIAFIAAGWLMAQKLKKPMEALHKGMLAVADGKLETQVHIKSGDEFEDLAIAFEGMRRGLLAGQQMQKAFERFAIRSQGHQQLGLVADNEFGVFMHVRLPGSANKSIHGLELFLGCIHDHGGLVHELGATNLLFRFIAAHPEDQPAYRATLCALALLNTNAPWSQPNAVGLIQANELNAQPTLLDQLLVAGSDIVTSVGCYQGIKDQVVADRMELRDGTTVYAIKAAI